MSAIEMLLQELDHEAKATRRVLERVPEDRLGWKPHDRSMSLGQLGLHVAIVPGAIAEMSQNSPFPVPQFKQPSATSVAQLVETLDTSLAKARLILGGLDDAALAKQKGHTQPRNGVEASEYQRIHDATRGESRCGRP